MTKLLSLIFIILVALAIVLYQFGSTISPETTLKNHFDLSPSEVRDLQATAHHWQEYSALISFQSDLLIKPRKIAVYKETDCISVNVYLHDGFIEQMNFKRGELTMKDLEMQDEIMTSGRFQCWHANDNGILRSDFLYDTETGYHYFDIVQ